MATIMEERKSADTARTFERRNPVTGEVATTSPAADADAARAAADSAAAALPGWSTLGPNARRAALNAAADALDRRANDFVAAMMGRSAQPKAGPGST